MMKFMLTTSNGVVTNAFWGKLFPAEKKLDAKVIFSFGKSHYPVDMDDFLNYHMRHKELVIIQRKGKKTTLAIIPLCVLQDSLKEYSAPVFRIPSMSNGATIELPTVEIKKWVETITLINNGK